MDRIFLAIIVSGLLLVATSTALLVFASNSHPMMTVTAVNLPASVEVRDTWPDYWPMSRRAGSDELTPADGARREQTRF